jgi:hypothetical protein
MGLLDMRRIVEFRDMISKILEIIQVEVLNIFEQSIMIQDGADEDIKGHVKRGSSDESSRSGKKLKTEIIKNKRSFIAQYQ